MEKMLGVFPASERFGQSKKPLQEFGLDMMKTCICSYFVERLLRGYEVCSFNSRTGKHHAL